MHVVAVYAIIVLCYCILLYRNMNCRVCLRMISSESAMQFAIEWQKASEIG